MNINSYSRSLGILSVLVFSRFGCGGPIDFAIIGTNGSINVLQDNNNMAGERQIRVEVSGSGEVAFRVTATTGTVPISYIQIRLMSGVTMGKMTVNDIGGTISYIREISRLSGGSSSPEFWLNNLDISGDLGEPGTSAGGTCTAGGMPTRSAARA